MGATEPLSAPGPAMLPLPVRGEAWPSCVRVPLRPVCHIPCRGRVLHGTRLNEALAMTMLAVPSCVPVSAPQQASACARALSTVTSCQPHCNSSQPFAPVFAAAGLSLLPAWCAARLAGGQPGGLPSSQHWHAGAAERHAPWGHRRGARRCWRVGHVKSGLFSLYSALSQVTLRLTSSPRRPRCVSTNS